jgi:signal transduction histidine kinase
MDASAQQPQANLSRHRLVILTALVSLAATAAVLLFPAVRFAYNSPPFHIVVETIAALTAALTALLFYGRLRVSSTPSGAALVYALVLSALANFALSVVPSVVGGAGVAPFSEWGALLSRLVSTAGFAYAAFASGRQRRARPHLGWWIVGAAGLTVAVIVLAVWVVEPSLPGAVSIGSPAGPALLRAHPAVLVAQLLGLVLFAAAAVGFSRRATATGDVLMRWLAAGALIAAFSRLHYALYPSLYTEWVYTGDFLRLGFHGLLLAGAVGEIRRYWLGLAEAGALAERRRLARDLHDGVAQELAFIVAQARLLGAEHKGDDTVRTITSAADRALDESRRAIAALTHELDQPFDLVLEQAAEEVAERVGLNVELDIERGIDLPGPLREALIRITREAITNAGRHSQSDAVSVRLSANGRVRLEVSDQGVGFDPAATSPLRFGLISMRERAQALDAEFEITSSPGHGTTVEVLL